MPAKYECSAAATQRGEQMFATGSQVRGWLLIEVRGAWGRDAIHESAFGEHVPPDWKDQLRRSRIRAVCVRSHLRDDVTDVRLYASTARRPGRGPPPLWRLTVDSLGDVMPAARELRVDRPPPSEWERVGDKLILVCTNGRHDQCCANLGRPLVRALRESAWADRVWECSHIGGDRFAANVVMLPDSIYFGRVDPANAASVLGAFDAGRLDLCHFRGRTSYTLAEQAVEHFVRSELGVDALEGMVVEPRNDDGAFPVRLGERLVHVRVRRRMVSVAEPLTCHGEPGQLVPTFMLESIV